MINFLQSTGCGKNPLGCGHDSVITGVGVVVVGIVVTGVGGRGVVVGGKVKDPDLATAIQKLVEILFKNDQLVIGVYYLGKSLCGRDRIR